MTAKTEKVSKSQLIRDQLKSMKPSERNPKAIVEALKKKGCVVSPTFVSVVKSKMKPKKRRVAKSKNRSATRNRKIDIQNGKDFGNLILAKNFLAAAGGIDHAKRVLDAVNKLVS